MKKLIGFAFIGMVLLSGCGQQEEGKAIIRTEFGDKTANSEQEQDAENTTAQKQPAPNSACQLVTFENVKLTHCIADPKTHRILTDLGPKTGGPYRDLANLAASRSSDAAPVVFAVNGGMFDDEGKPIGYYVENGDRLKELSLADGPGNFHMKPNGVFYGSGTSWRVRTTDDFYRNVGDRPRFGTQSGPMLVIKGKIHPQISENGPSRAIRNGVGIDDAGRAHFVISEEVINFGSFARFFRDQAKTPNALFLDGNVSALWDPASDRLDRGAALGPLIIVEQRE